MISYDHSSEPLRKGSPSSVCGSEMESIISRSFLFHKVLINLSSPAQHCVQCQPEPSDTVLKPQLIKHLLSTLPSPFTPFQLPKHTERKAEMNREMTRRAFSLKEGSVATSGPVPTAMFWPCQQAQRWPSEATQSASKAVLPAVGCPMVASFGTSAPCAGHWGPLAFLLCLYSFGEVRD